MPRVAASMLVVVLLIGGVLLGRAVRESGCGHGEQAVLAEITPLGNVQMSFSEEALKDTCQATYITPATPSEVLAHHAAQLTAHGWAVEGPFLAPQWDPPHLSARHGDFGVDFDVVPANDGNMVRLSAHHRG